MDEARGEGGIYVREQSGKGRCGRAFPDRGGRQTRRGKHRQDITNKIQLNDTSAVFSYEVIEQEDVKSSIS